MIQAVEKVQAYFGYWPEFCDAKITSIVYEAPSCLVLGLRYIDNDLGRAADIQLKFFGVADMALTDLSSDNVIDALEISDGSPIAVSLEACCGLDGQFLCTAVEVLSLVPRAFERPW
jgi:hypothetical protein